MNWVGGSRTRVLIKQERRKQKEYFEKKRLKSKMKLLGVLSPVKNSAVSLDLLNLYMVNQISCQKKTSETARKPVHVNMNRDIKMPLRKHDLELPMSPHCAPSNLCIDDIENNKYYQRLDSKEELGPAQLSNVNYSNSLVSKLNESQDALSSSYETAQFGTLFERLNCPGNRDVLTGRPAIDIGEDCGSMDERRQSDFITEKKSLQHIWGENREEASDEDVNQPLSSLQSENSASFISENIINLLNIDQQKIKKTFDGCGYDNMGDICGVISSDKNHFTDQCIRSIFTDPDLTLSNSTFNKEHYPEKCQPNKNCQKEYNNNERYNFSTSFEKDYYPSSSDKKGKFESDYQEKTPQKKIQKYSVNHMGYISLEELHSKQSQDFGRGEILVEERGMCSLKGRAMSAKNNCQYNYLDSSQSSQSTGYSPRPTDSCFSSSSEMPSEDEDQILHQTEDSNKRSIKTKETSSNFNLESMGKLPYDRIIKNNANFHKQCESFHQLSMKNNTDQFPQPQCNNSAHILHNKTSNNYILQFAKCDAWAQTESEPVMEGKLDAAVQCDIISKCKCRSDVASFCNVERCNENIKADTTGGQTIL
ncbi:regulator of DNA class I crossover intermediates 1 isoform X3 [Vicugna pacos]|uniref:Regulator of DNA class I crossover intermediates 1 isoform X3 n=1 Tax=Vicugna pacos TaxID=30538 RepID=A0ABM5E7G1_VICPA